MKQFNDLLKPLYLASLAILVTSLSPFDSLAAGGGVGGPGGGNLVLSTPADIKEAFSDAANRGVFFTLMHFFDNQEHALKPITTVADPELRDLLLKMSQDAVQSDLRQSPMVFKNSPCVSVVGQEQASVKANQPHSEICVSLSMLARTPKANLKTDAINLLIRESAHHFGAGEALADKVQSFYSGWMLRADPLFGALSMIEDQIKEVFVILNLLPSSTFADEQICSELGTLAGLERGYESLMHVLGNAHAGGIVDYGVSSIDTVDLQSLSDKWIPFCGTTSRGIPSYGSGYDVHKELTPVSKGNRDELSNSLKAYVVLLRKQRAEFPVQNYYPQN